MEFEAPKEITFTREQFYEKVWSAPATKLASELGCSDVMIAKICKNYNIPKPYLGYWAMLEYGKSPEKTPLPKNDAPAIQSLTFHKQAECETSIEEAVPDPLYDLDVQQLLDKARSMEPVTVADSLRNPHPLVAATREELRISRIPFYERSAKDRRERGPTLDVSGGEESTARALRIMNALIKRVEKIGGTVEIKKEKWREYRTQTVVSFAGEDVSVIRLREKLNQVRIPPDKEKHSWGPKVDFLSSGMLILDQGPSYDTSILLRDTPKHHRIEEGLNDLIIDFVRWAGEKRIRRRQEEVDRKRREEEDRIRRQKEEELRQKREELAKRQKAEQARVDELVRHAKSWKQARTLREYITAVHDLLIRRDGAIADDSEALRYLRWAKDQADRMDPLMASPPSVLDEQI